MDLLFLGHRYVVASIEYRSSWKAPFPAQISDCKAAVRWLRANAEKYNLDPNRIGAWGGSAGGHLVGLLGTAGEVREFEGTGGNPGYPSNVQAVCAFSGVYDFQQVLEPEFYKKFSKLRGLIAFLLAVALTLRNQRNRLSS